LRFRSAIFIEWRTKPPPRRNPFFSSIPLPITIGPAPGRRLRHMRRRRAGAAPPVLPTPQVAKPKWLMANAAFRTPPAAPFSRAHPHSPDIDR